MKINKTILVAALAVSVATIANAEIYLTGSTAARAAVYACMTNPGSVFSSAPIVTGYGAAGAGDSYVAFYGTLVGGGTETINCHWSGSEAGIGDVGTPGKTESFIADSLISSSASSDTAGNPGSTQTAQVDLCLADNAQAYSPAGKALDGGNLTGTKIGIVPFKWVRNNGLWTGGNITDSQIRAALTGGIKMSVLTGNSTDTSYVYVAGRDASSGTRVNAFGESGFGINQAPAQIELSGGSMVALGSSHGVSFYIGNYGQSSGGTLANSLGTSTAGSTDQVKSGTGFSAIAYLGISDANTAITAGATLLTYNGIAYSSAAVIEGQYTFWGNEYVYENPGYSGEDSNVGAVYSSLINGTTGVTANADGISVISLGAMHCTRSGPTADPAHN